MRRYVTGGGLVATAVGVLLAACASESVPSPSSGAADAGEVTDAAPAADSDAGLLSLSESMTVLLVQATPPLSATAPLANGWLIFDKPGGERVEVQAGEDGLVTVTGIDWSKGTAAMTVYGDNTVVTSFVALTKDEVARTAATYRPAVPGDPKRDYTAYTFASTTAFPKLSGKVTHNQGTNALFTPSIIGSPFQNGPTSYSGRVQPGKPFSIVTLDWSAPKTPTVGPRGREFLLKRWGQVDHAALTADATLDIDLDAVTPLATATAKGRLTIPGGAPGPLGGQSTGSVNVSNVESGSRSVLGTTTKIDVTPNGAAFDFDVEYVMPTGLSPVTTFWISLPDGASSTKSRLGWPTDGATIDGFLLPPVMVETTRSLEEVFTIDGVAATSVSRVATFDAKGETKWNIFVPPGVTSFTPPVLGEAAQAAVGGATKGVLIALADYDPASTFYLRSSASRPFKLK